LEVISETLLGIEHLFESLTKVEVLKVLTMSAALRQHRIISFERSLSTIVPSASPGNASSRGRKNTLTPVTRPKWKDHPEWKEANALHLNLISELKNSSGGDSEALKVKLRTLESDMKALKRKLQDFR
jgi:hypothetical protein